MKPSAGSIPRLIISDSPTGRADTLTAALQELNPIGVLLSALSGTGLEARRGLATLLQSLIEEGKRFGQAPAGLRWAQILSDSPAVERGRILWNQANVDYYLRNAEPLADSPAALLEDALDQLARMDLATLSAQLSQINLELEAAMSTSDGNRP